MKLKDLLDKIVNTYMNIDIREYDKMTYTGVRYNLGKMQSYKCIPEYVLDKEVGLIKPYEDILIIEIKA